VKVVSERLGHKSVTFTIDAYVHVLEDQREAAAATLDAVVTL
jgi:integrase